MMKFVSSLFVALLLLAAPAAAQTPAMVKMCVQTSPTVCTPVSATAPLPTTGGGGGGSTQVVGNVASGATDSGNPVKVGGVFNTTPPTLTTGQRGDMQLTNSGYLITAPIVSNTAGTGDAGGTTANYFVGGTASGVANSQVRGYIFNNSTWDRMRGINGAVPAGTGTQAVAIAPTSASQGGITSTVTGAAANNLVLKASAGNLYSVYATNLTATAGFLVILNSATAPADGAIAPLECVPLPANGNASINYNAGPPAVFATGITAVFTTAATCFTKTTGTGTAFIRGSVQ